MFSDDFIDNANDDADNTHDEGWLAFSSRDGVATGEQLQRIADSYKERSANECRAVESSQSSDMSSVHSIFESIAKSNR